MENKLLELIKTRRSVRSFSDREISRDDLEKIAEAAIYAPSAMNKQTWQFTVVTDKSKIKALASAVGKALCRDDYVSGGNNGGSFSDSRVNGAIVYNGVDGSAYGQTV